MWWSLISITVGLFGLGAWLGAPWLPTRRRESRIALELLDLEPGQTVIDLGSGSGSFAAEATRAGLKVIGYEINPLLWLYSRIRTWPHRKSVRLYLRDYWRTKLPECDGVYIFLIERYMAKLDRKLRRELKGDTPVVSYAFKIPGRQHKAESKGLYLYKYKSK